MWQVWVECDGRERQKLLDTMDEVLALVRVELERGNAVRVIPPC